MPPGAPASDMPGDPALTLCRVFKFRYRLQRVLGGARQHELAVVGFALVDGDGHIVLAEAEEPTHAHNGVGDGLVGRDDDVVHLAYALALVIVYGRAENLLLRAPSVCEGCSLRRRHADGRRARDLGRHVRGGDGHLTPMSPATTVLRIAALLSYGIVSGLGRGSSFVATSAPCFYIRPNTSRMITTNTIAPSRPPPMYMCLPPQSGCFQRPEMGFLRQNCHLASSAIWPRLSPSALLPSSFHRHGARCP
jgi:hypothetical protein